MSQLWKKPFAKGPEALPLVSDELAVSILPCEEHCAGGVSGRERPHYSATPLHQGQETSTSHPLSGAVEQVFIPMVHVRPFYVLLFVAANCLPSCLVPVPCASLLLMNRSLRVCVPALLHLPALWSTHLLLTRCTPHLSTGTMSSSATACG